MKFPTAFNEVPAKFKSRMPSLSKYALIEKMIKCPRCNLRWFWHGLAKDSKRNIMIDNMSHRPRCNYPEKEKVDVKPAFISKKPIPEVTHQKRKYHFLWSVLIIAILIMLIGVIGLVSGYRLFELWRF